MADKVQDYYWSEEAEPHLARRKAIMKEHPEVKKLFGVNPRLKYFTTLWVVVQLVVAWLMGQYLTSEYYGTYGIIPFLLVAYLVGGSIAQALFLAVHEITHDLAFKKRELNNWLAYIANLPIVFPFAISFKHYHGEHHWKQGKDGVDTDIPSQLEAKLFRGLLGKILWYVSQIFFYAFRPVLTFPMKWDKWQVYNVIVQVLFIVPFIYFAGWGALVYLLLSMLFAGGLHPTAGHFISEHYVFDEKQETYSYYGPLNLITFNVGYHNEHHDFPNIPGNRLPELKKLAPEYYDNLISYDSWLAVTWKFLFTPGVTLYSRTKRN